jgi:hypothetical protein
MISKTSKTSGPVMMKNGGAVNQHKRMAMGMMGGGMMNRGYKKGGAVKKKVKKMRMGGSCG